MNGMTTAESECRFLGSRERSNQTMPIESTATSRAPDPRENDSRNNLTSLEYLIKSLCRCSRRIRVRRVNVSKGGIERAVPEMLPDQERIRASVLEMVKEVQKYVPGYRLVNGPVFDGKKVATFMEVAGLGRQALYAGSWSEWCSDPSRPMAQG